MSAPRRRLAALQAQIAPNPTRTPSDERLTVLIANRGDSAVRVLSTTTALGHSSVVLATAAEADPRSALAASLASSVVTLSSGTGPAAYSPAAIAAAAVSHSVDVVHPGIGLASEDPQLATLLADAGIAFAGPSAAALRLFGDKTAARGFVDSVGVPVLPGTPVGATLKDAHAFFAANGPMMVKAAKGGGGRGMRVVSTAKDVESMYTRATSEALAAGGDADVFVEKLVMAARHVEVQVVSDGKGGVVTLGTRDCSLQLHRQKVIEMAPALCCSASTTASLTSAAASIIGAVPGGYRGLATVEFLVDAHVPATSATATATATATPQPFFFIEVNPRLQVEHTVTECAYGGGLDLVAVQLALATRPSASLADLSLDASHLPALSHVAIQARVNVSPAASPSDVVSSVAVPGGPGLRWDSCVRVGQTLPLQFDGLVGKLVSSYPVTRHHPVSTAFERALRRLRTALPRLCVEGVPNNIVWLNTVLALPEVAACTATTRLVENMGLDLVEPASPSPSSSSSSTSPSTSSSVLVSPLTGTVVSVVSGEIHVTRGDVVAVVYALKLEHEVRAPADGLLRALVSEGAVVDSGQPLASYVALESAPTAGAGSSSSLGGAAAPPPPHQPPTVSPHHEALDDLRAALAATQDGGGGAKRAAKIDRRASKGLRTARQNLADLLDGGNSSSASWVEFGQLAVPAQRSSSADVADLRDRCPADSIITGVGTVVGAPTGVILYDALALAGTQGFFGHKKLDRILEYVEANHLPVVLFAEGGGGRPGDVDTQHLIASGLCVESFESFARLSGSVPLIGVVAGYCFAGNAALAGMSDVLICVEGASLGMAGPAMLEGAGMPSLHPSTIGPTAIHAAAGSVDIVVESEAEAVAVVRQLLHLISKPDCGSGSGGAVVCPALRTALPDSRKRAYDVRTVVEAIVDDGTWLELRPTWGVAIITGFGRIDGLTAAILANNPHSPTAGAIDADAALKAARFAALADSYGVPIVSMVDTPGFMVGPAHEATGAVRKLSRLFVTAASTSVPWVTLVMRKAYGLGAQAMAGGRMRVSHSPTLAWPLAEFGPMGMEGAVSLGFKGLLASVEDDVERQTLFESLVAQAYAQGKALNVASLFEVDAVVDPADTRAVLGQVLRHSGKGTNSGNGNVHVHVGGVVGGRRPCVEPW